MIKFIDFWAPWCGPCKMMAPIFEELKKEFDGKVEFEEHNVDENGPEVQKYNVMSIPTYVVLKDGVEVGRKIGFTPKAELVKLLSA
jgi:thioredoxin 1